MPTRQEAHVTPAVLQWGRKSAALDIDAAAKKLRVRPEQIEAWESGDRRPTLKQLRRLAKIYHRPFAAFFRSEPPSEPGLPTDFRSGPGHIRDKVSSALARELRRARFRHRTALDLTRDTAEPVKDFSLLVSLEDPVKSAAQDCRNYLQIPLDQQKKWPAGRETFNRWRAAFEASSILVFQTADVELKELRGFSLFFEQLPVIVVNRKDALAGKVFTLFHELAHLATRRAGMCGFDGDAGIEVYCNDLAAETLVPERDFLLHFRSNLAEFTDETVRQTATTYGVSREMIWRRHLRFGHITEEFYRHKRDELQEEFQEMQEVERVQRQQGDGGPPPARNAVSLSGRLYTNLVLSAWQSESITAADVAEFVGVRAKHFEKVVREAATGTS